MLTTSGLLEVRDASVLSGRTEYSLLGQPLLRRNSSQFTSELLRRVYIREELDRVVDTHEGTFIISSLASYTMSRLVERKKLQSAQSIRALTSATSLWAPTPIPPTVGAQFLRTRPYAENKGSVPVLWGTKQG